MQDEHRRHGLRRIPHDVGKGVLDDKIGRIVNIYLRTSAPKKLLRMPRLPIKGFIQTAWAGVREHISYIGGP